MSSNLGFYSRKTVHTHNFNGKQKRVYILQADYFILLKLKLNNNNNNNKVHQLHSNRQAKTLYHDVKRTRQISQNVI